jgi:hypothetical protein
MTGTTIRTIIALILIVHGVGHLMGVIPALRLFGTESGTGPEWFKNWSSDSWILTDILGGGVSRVICFIIFMAAFIGFISAGLGLLGWLIPHEGWRVLAVISAVVSLVAIILYWNAFIYLFPHKVGAFAVNIAVLICLLLANWPREADIVP